MLLLEYHKRHLQFSNIIEGMIEFHSSKRTEIKKVIEELQKCDGDSEVRTLILSH